MRTFRRRQTVGRRSEFYLCAVAVAFFVGSVTLVDVTRFLVFDEAIYLSEVQKGAEGINFASHRARGITWLMAPVAGLGGSITAVRIWLATLSAVGLYLAFRPWVNSVGVGAPAAAAICGTCWTVLLYATDISPNLLGALAAVSATGYAFAPVSAGRRSQIFGAFVAMAVLALLRPSETVWLGLLFAVALPFRGRRGIAVLVSAGAGTAVGLIPWIVEAYLRFGGPIERYLQVRNRILAVDFSGRRILRYLRAADGPIPRGFWDTTPQPDPDIAPLVVLAAVVLLALIILGITWPRSRVSAVAVRAAATAGLVLLLPYVFLNSSVYARFLLPAWALVTLPVAEAIVSLVSRTRNRLVVFVLVTIAALWLWGQFNTLRTVGGSVASAERELELLARDVAPLVDEPCFLLTESGYAQLGYGVGCLSDWYAPADDPSFRRAPETYAAGGRAVYVLGRTPHPLLEDWPSQPVPRHPEWTLYEMPKQQP